MKDAQRLEDFLHVNSTIFTILGLEISPDLAFEIPILGSSVFVLRVDPYFLKLLLEKR